MYVFVGLWSGNATWWSLDREARERFMADVGPGVAGLAEQGIEALAWGRNDADVDARVDFDYFAVWRMPSREHAAVLEQAIRDFGWYAYMDQVNAGGMAATPVDIAAQQASNSDERSC